MGNESNQNDDVFQIKKEIGVLIMACDQITCSDSGSSFTAQRMNTLDTKLGVRDFFRLCFVDDSLSSIFSFSVKTRSAGQFLGMSS